MSRRALALAALVAASVGVVGGCQSYNFNPVGACLIQPGQVQVPLVGVSTADVLFVVDDSGSMDSKQQALAQNFSSFIGSLATAQADRAATGLEPFDFHIAVTTSSIFLAQPSGSTYTLTTSYPNPLPLTQCTAGQAIAGAPYPAGNFVAPGTNPKVLHFTKDLTWATCNSGGACNAACTAGCTPGCTTTAGVTTCTDARINTLIQQFVGTCSSPAGPCSPSCTGTCSGGNVEVGSCGSGEEQHLQGARLALQKALAGAQPGVAPGEFPHVGAKLVVVWVGDEDDCSSPQSSPLVLNGGPGADTCVADKNLPQVQQKEYSVAEFDSFFSSLVAPLGQLPSPASPYSSLGAGFIVSANRCTAAGSPVVCAPADSSFVQSPASCTGTPQYACNVAFAAGVRFLQLAETFKGHQDDVIEGTVCENFGPVLASIAELVKPVNTLRLPSTPAASEITVLRIVDVGGNTVKICTQRTIAGPVASPTTAEGWWFMTCGDTAVPPAVAAGPTSCLYINHQASLDPANSCEAQPGQTYSAEYIGQIPTGGCPGALTPAGALFCAQALSGNPDAGTVDAQRYQCYATAAGATGTCICL
jgi:hypothetical protein